MPAPDKLRVLILEDMPMDAELVEYELERANIGFVACRVDTEDGFRRALDEFHPDVILSDYTLPRFDGMAALALAKQWAPATPLLIVTGSVNEETAVGCMKAGAADYLLKGNLSRIGPAIEAALMRANAHAEQSRAQLALRRSEANLRALFNNSLQCFVLVDRTGTVQAFNPTADDWAVRLTGRRLAEGERIEEFLPGTAEGLAAAQAGETHRREYCIVDTAGTTRWFETSDVPVVDDAGDVIGVCMSAVNIDERRRAEQALRESEARYRDLFDNASDLVCVTSPGGTFLYTNAAWHAALGYAPQELAERQLADVVDLEDLDRCADAFGRVLAGESVGHLEIVLRTRAGASLTVEGSVSATFKSGRPDVVRGIFRDVSERKRVEEQLRRAERMQAAGRLAGGVAHEVNNMMTGVLGFASFVQKSLAPDDARHGDLDEIVRAGTRAADITRQLLAFTRQQYRRVELMDINTVLDRSQRMLRRSLGDDHVLDLKRAPEPCIVRVDHAQLEQVLVNLVLNARDAMAEPGRVSVEVTSVSLDGAYAESHPGVRIPPGAYVMLAVSDTGSGISAEVQAQMFEPFFTTKAVGKGTGLGLSTVYGIVKQSDGFVWAYSEVGHGTVFKIYLPRVKTSGPIAAAGNGASGDARGTETILVVEDEAIVRALTSRGLREHGYTVVETSTVSDAVAYLDAHRGGVHLVVSDVVMPVAGGRELGQRMAVMEPGIPILYMSGYTGEDVVERGLLSPGALFEQKPFAPDRLAQRVRQVLDTAEAARRRHSGPMPTL
ncbi:MAG TPA: PAS domain S-box protein [Gemmatimonadales bacterium]|nr:PAS domain S-box protein [Gemmatimonadales bacterium]